GRQCPADPADQLPRSPEPEGWRVPSPCGAGTEGCGLVQVHDHRPAGQGTDPAVDEPRDTDGAGDGAAVPECPQRTAQGHPRTPAGRAAGQALDLEPHDLRIV